MNTAHIERIAQELDLPPRGVQACADLLADGATVPFISRYRKEATGSLDEVAVTGIRDRLEQLEALDKRRESILGSLEERHLLTPDLKKQILGAATLPVLEDIYLPFKPKRRTKASMARDAGLEPLALWLHQTATADRKEAVDEDPAVRAAAFVDTEKGVASGEEALQGARHILAEMINEDSNGKSPWAGWPGTVCWPCAGAKRRRSWPCASPRRKRAPSPCWSACSVATAPGPRNRCAWP